jgi:N-acetylmuramoyl-L-alanine amidase
MQRRVLWLVVVVACSHPARPRDDDPVRATGAVAPPRSGPAPATEAATPPANADAKPEANADAKAKAKPEAKADAKPGANADANAEAKTIVKSAAPGGVGDGRGAGIDAPRIIDAPMAWSDEREQLTLAYRRQHSDPDATDLTIDPRVIVLHYTAGGTAIGTRRYFDNVRIEAGRKQLARAGVVNVSAHFIVDRDGTIYQLQSPTRFARHCIGLNHVAIGIENVGDEAKLPLTDAQVEADAALVRALATRYPITHLLGHHEVMQFRRHPYYVERDAAYRNDKPDPGPRFMALVRERVADLKLEGLGP